MAGVLSLMDFSRGRHGLHFCYAIDEHRFATTFWYSDVDFDQLEARYSAEQLRRVYLHIGAFEMCKLTSLDPSSVSFGPFADVVDEEFARLWHRLITGIWAQWRYENDLPFWQPPAVVVEPTTARHLEPIAIDPGNAPYLAFCGGGKDTAVTRALLSRAGAKVGSLAYAHSTYGRADRQFEIVDALLDALPAGPRHRLTVCDTFADAPLSLVRAEFGIASVTAAETPTSIFASVPIALQHGYTHLVLGHEKSADVGNLVWEVTGEDVNHQWGKSREAETVLADYLRSRLVGNLNFFSVLKPVHDVVIFGALAGQPASVVRAAHSCNVCEAVVQAVPEVRLRVAGLSRLPRRTARTVRLRAGPLRRRGERADDPGVAGARRLDAVRVHRARRRVAAGSCALPGPRGPWSIPPLGRVR